MGDTGGDTSTTVFVDLLRLLERLGSVGITINPFTLLGGAVSSAATDVWRNAMVSLWSAGLWLLRLAFTVIDAFTTPDVSASGPLGAVLPMTVWVGGSVGLLTLSVQLMTALVRRDGQSLGRLFLGVLQFGAVWAAYLGIAAGLIISASGLEKGILESTVHVGSMSGIDLAHSWPRNVTDATAATVLGILSLILIIPAAFFYVLIMVVREAALLILVATSPISAAGLLSETTKAWFWKSLRWFFSCLLISPTAALVLGIGVQISDGVVSGAGNGLASAVGTAVVGAVVIAIGACCPLVLFRLLAFVEPGTASGAALRQSWSEAGGMSGLLGGGRSAAGASSGGSAALSGASDGRSGGESGADGATRSRMAGALAGLSRVGAAVGTAMHAATAVAQRAVDVGSDVLGQAGVGSPGYSMTPTDERYSRMGSTSSPRQQPGTDAGAQPPQPDPGSAPRPAGPAGSMPPLPAPNLPLTPAASSGSGAAGAAEVAAL